MRKIKFIYFIILVNFFSFSASADALFKKGRDVFLNIGMCGSCHTLSDAKSEGKIGPNLNDLKPDTAKVIHAVKNGIGVMPSFDGILSKEDIEAVAHYVSTSSFK